MTVSIHGQSLGKCDCGKDAHAYVTVGKVMTAFCIECVVDNVQDAILNMAIASVG